MARTIEEINADLASLKQLVEEMMQTANTLMNFASQDYVQAVGTIRKSWEGDMADFFANKSTVVQNEITNTASKLSAAAQTIYTEVKNYLEAEAKAIQISQS